MAEAAHSNKSHRVGFPNVPATKKDSNNPEPCNARFKHFQLCENRRPS